jgi:hypothetical protein
MESTALDAKGDGQPAIVIAPEDLDATARNRIEAAKAKDVILDSSAETAAQVVYDSVPSIIAKKLKKITPQNFVLAEIECKFRIVGKIPTVELNGEVTVKFRPS